LMTDLKKIAIAVGRKISLTIPSHV